MLDFLRRPRDLDHVSFLSYARTVERTLRQNGFTHISSGDMGFLADILAFKRGLIFGFVCRQNVRTKSVLLSALEAASDPFYATRQFVFVTPHSLERRLQDFAEDRGLFCVSLEELVERIDQRPHPHAGIRVLAGESNSS
jgi:hypothetical protein